MNLMKLVLANAVSFTRKGTIYCPDGDPDDKHDGPLRTATTM
jgi:hypothetical protein